jgi:hypothetical protein
MLVHSDESRKNSKPGHVENFGVFRYRCLSRTSHRRNTPTVNYYGLVVRGRGAGTVDHAHVRQRDYWIIDTNEAPRVLREIRDVLGCAEWRGG